MQHSPQKDDQPWCPPLPDHMDNPTEEELMRAAEKLDTMVEQLQANPTIFFTPSSLGALPALWLQAKLTITLQPFQDKLSRLFLAIAAELWLRGRLAEQLAQYITSLMRHAAELATPHTQCLLYARYCFRPILSKLLDAISGPHFRTFSASNYCKGNTTRLHVNLTS